MKARAPLVAYCEGDDFWRSRSKLRRQVEHMMAEPQCAAIHSDFDRIVLRKGRWMVAPGVNTNMGRNVPSGSVFRELLKGNFVQTCTLLARTKDVQNFLRSELPTESFPVIDWALCLFLASRGSLKYMPDSTAVYRQVAGSAMNSGNAARLRTVQGYVGMIEAVCREFDVPTDDRDAALFPIRRALLSLSVLASDPSAFKEAHDWLLANDSGYLRPMRRRLLPLLVRSPLACKALARIQVFRSWMFRRSFYRLPLDRSTASSA